MDTKDLRTEPAVEDRNNDVKATFLRNGNSYKCMERSKSYQDSSTVPLSKVEVQTTRPCAVIGPDRIITRPSYSANSPTVKSHEYWNIENGHPDYPYRPGEYQDLTRNISPRLTYQENMLRVMVPNRYPGAGKHIEDINCSSDKNNQPMQMHVKSQVPGENKLCDVPYNQNPNLNEHRIDKCNETGVPNVNSSTLKSVPHGWPGTINVRPPLSYSGSEIYPYPEFPSNTAPRALPLIRPHRSRHDEPVSIYGDVYYKPTNIRYEPYALAKERYPQPRYEFLNYPNSYHPTPNYPSPKYDLPKFPHQYGYSQIPYKVRDSQVDYYKQPFPPKSHNLSYQNHELHSNYTQLPGACLQNKYTYPGEANLNSSGVSKSTYDLNNKQFAPPKPYPENYYINELQRQQMKGPIINRNYMHVAPPYPYYRRENFAYKHNEITSSQIKNPDSVYNNHLHRMHFSPNIISSGDYGISQEDCGYVSQSSTTSVNSSDSVYNMYRAYDSKYGYANRNHPFFKETSASIISANKQKRDIDVRQFLQMWNEGEEEINESSNKEVNAEQIPKDCMNAQDQLYVLGLVNVPSEELGKYEHIQKVSKLPENIKGYTNLELLSQFEQAIGTSNLSQPEHKSFGHSKIAKEPLNPLSLPSDPLSPLDVESKISQSIIHKEVGCNFEIKPCSPQMYMAELTSASTLSVERSIEKVHNPHKPLSPLTSCDKENVKCTQINMTSQKGTVVGKHSNLSISTSCEMEKANCSPRHTLDTVKPKYTYQDLEGNAGICLASLPRIDSDIELSFPEVNQQFINANKPDTVSPNNNTQDEMKAYNNPLKGLKKDDGNTFQNKQINKSLQSVRTDSVIIKNPENIIDKLECNSKEANCTENFIDVMSSTPINLALTSKSKSNRIPEHKNKEYHLSKSNFSIDEAINLSLNPIDPLYEEQFDSLNECQKNEWNNSAFPEHADDAQLEAVNSCYIINSTECNKNSSQIKQNVSPLESKTEHEDITRPEIIFEKNDSINQSIKKNNITLASPTKNENILVQPCNTIKDVKINTTMVKNLKPSNELQPKEKTQISGPYIEGVEKRQKPSENNFVDLITVESNSDSMDHSLIETGEDTIDSSSKILETDDLVSIPKYESVKFNSKKYFEANKLNKETSSPENCENIKTEHSLSFPITDKNQSVEIQKLKDDISENNTGELNTKLPKIPGKVWGMKDQYNISSAYRHNKTKEIITTKQTCDSLKSHNNHEVIVKSKKSYNFFKKHYCFLYQNLILGGNTGINKINAYNLSQNVCQNIDDNINIPCMELNEIQDEPPCSEHISTNENPVITSYSKSDEYSLNIYDKSNHSHENAIQKSCNFLVPKVSNKVEKNIKPIDILSEELIWSEPCVKNEYKANTQHDCTQTQSNSTNQLEGNDNVLSNSAMDSSKIKSTDIANQSKFVNDIISPCMDFNKIEDEPPCRKYISTDENPVTTSYSKSDEYSFNMSDKSNHSNENTNQNRSNFLVAKASNKVDKNIKSIDDLSEELLLSESCVKSEYKANTQTQNDYTQTQSNSTNQLEGNDNVLSNSAMDSSKIKPTDIANQAKCVNDISSPSSTTTNDTDLNVINNITVNKVGTVQCVNISHSQNEYCVGINIKNFTLATASNNKNNLVELTESKLIESKKYKTSTDHSKNIENHDDSYDMDMDTNEKIFKITNADLTESHLNEIHFNADSVIRNLAKDNAEFSNTSNLPSYKYSVNNENNKNEMVVKICKNDDEPTDKFSSLAHTSIISKPIIETAKNDQEVNNTCKVIAKLDKITTSNDSLHCAKSIDKSITESEKQKNQTTISEPKLEKIKDKKVFQSTNEVIEAATLNKIQTSTDSFHCANMKNKTVAESTNDKSSVQIDYSITQTLISKQKLDPNRSIKNINDTYEVIEAAILNEIETSNDSFHCKNIEYESMSESADENFPVETDSSLAQTSPKKKLDEARDKIDVKAAILNEIQTSNDSLNYDNIERKVTTKSSYENSPAKIYHHEHVDQNESYVRDNDKTSHVKAPSPESCYDECTTTDYRAKQDSKDSVSSTCILNKSHIDNKCEIPPLFQTDKMKRNSQKIQKNDKQQPEYLLDKIKSKALLPVIVNYSDSDDDSNSDLSESYENFQQTSPSSIKKCDSNISSQFLNNQVNVIPIALDINYSMETKYKLKHFLCNESEGLHDILNSETKNKYYDVESTPNCDVKAMGCDTSDDDSFLQYQATVDSNEHFKLSTSKDSSGAAILEDTNSPGGDNPEETDNPRADNPEDTDIPGADSPVKAIDKNNDKKYSSDLLKSNKVENHYDLTTNTCENNNENNTNFQDGKDKFLNNFTSTLNDKDVLGNSENKTKEKRSTDLSEKSETIYIPLSSNVEVAIMDVSPVPDNHKEPLKDQFIKKTLKRSLSDSVIYNSGVLDGIYNECKSPLWPHKRKKLFHEEATQNHASLEFGTRRISLSPSAATEQVSFCILIDNDYVLSQESQDCPEAISLTDLHEDNIVTDTIICSDSVVDCVSPTSDLEHNYINFSSDTNDQTTITDWDDDVACVETVVTDNNNENDGDIVDWRNEDDNSNSGYILQEGYNEDISYDFIYHNDYSPVNDIQLDQESHHLNEVDVPSNLSDSESINVQFHTASDDYDEFIENASQRTASRSQSLNSVDKNSFCDIGADIVYDDMNEVSSSSKSFSSRSPTEVSSTTPEDKRSNILLKITNHNGSRTSQTTFELPNRKIRCKFTEKDDYLSTRSFLNQTKPLITKAAQKYIPPLPVPDLRVSLRLSSHILDKLRLLKHSPPNSLCKKMDLEASTQRPQLPIKKPKPNFEDVLMNIDKAQVELQKDKLKKLKRNVPKVIIKKTQNGSHYTSPAAKRYNPDLTGRKWQPWVVIERNKFIDKMSIKGKTKAVYCHRKRTYILFEKKYKYKAASIASANFVISQFQSDHNKYKNQLKYTFRLKSGI